MSKIQIVTDSASDITFEAEKQYGIKVISFSVFLGEQTYTSRVDYDNEKFYQMMEEHSDEIPKTSQITAYQFEEEYKALFDQGVEEAIFVLINKNGSSTFGNAVMARESFFEDHPEAAGKMKIFLHDSGTYTGAYGYLAVKAAKMAQEGKSADEINAYLNEVIPKRCVYFGMYDLTYAGKSGRIPSAAAFLGNKLGVKPVMKLYDHEIVTAAKCRGEKKLLAKVAELVVEEMKPGSPYQVVYAKDTESRDEMIEKMTAAVGYGPDEICQVGAEVAANAGIKLAGVIFDMK